MDEIIKTSRNHLFASIALLVLLVIGIAAFHTLKQPSLFIPPPESERTKLEQVIRESENIEAIKNSCAIFARCRDDSRVYTALYKDHLNKLIKFFIICFALMFVSLGFGYYSIYKKAKKINEDNERAL